MDDRTIRPVTVAELSLGADARSPGAARRFLSSTLVSWGKTEYSDDGALLLSELVTNATLHARTQIVVRIELKSEALHIAVTDSSPRQPAVRHYSEQSTTGRGLGLVSALARNWGVEQGSGGTKTVWAEIIASHAARHPGSMTVDLHAFPDLEDSAPGGAGDQEETSACLRAA
jgi:anti-sigma regulatory factor (Ser/Thr protein kinase)